MKEIKEEKFSSDLENSGVKKDVDEDFLLTYEQIPKAKLKEEPKETIDKKNYKHQCETCAKYFARKAHLTSHLKFHNKKKVSCGKCQRTFISEGKFNIHRCIDDLTCSECKKVFNNINYIKIHLKKFHDIEMCAIIAKKYEMFCCDYCGKEFDHKSAIAQHILSHTDQRVECKFCHSKVRNINHHVAKFHPKIGGKFKCQKCPKIFQTKLLLDIHLKTHNKKFACNICERKFQCKKYLQDHMKFHENPEEFKCKICGHQFTDKWDLKKHLKIHETNREKNLNCNHCEYKTDSRQILKSHVKVHEKLELKLKKFDAVKCDECSAVLKNKDSYYQHKRRQHKNKKVFCCDLCDYKSNFKQNVRGHLLNMHFKFKNK